MTVGYIGLGKMGKNMVVRLLENNIEVAAWNRSSGPREEVEKAGAQTFSTVEALVAHLQSPKIIWLMLPAGQATDDLFQQVIPLLSVGDTVIDGANSFFKDTLTHAGQAKKRGISFIDVGVSGGPEGARHGACLMIGGSKDDVKRIEPIVQAIAAPNAWSHVGNVGAGHFVKMVHNGIEYGMMEAIGEGMAVLRTSPFEVNLEEVTRIYNTRSVIESRLIGWTHAAFLEDPNLSTISSQIAHSGEGEWTIDAAHELGVSVPIIEKSFQVRVESSSVDEGSPDAFRNKVVSAQRGQFGGHAVHK